MILNRKLGTFPVIILGLMTALLLTGCLGKKNPTGNNWSDVRPLSFTDVDCFTAGYSYPGEKKVSGSETTLLAGNFGGSEAVAFMRFTGLPAEGEFSIPAAYQDSTYLELTLLKRSPLARNQVDLTVYKLNQSWAADSTSLIQDANLSPVTTQAFTIPDTILAAGTVVKIPLPLAEIENWRSSADTLGLTLAIKTNADAWVEMVSTEPGRGPKLRFLYRNDDDVPDDDDSEYALRSTKDSYRVSAEAAPLLDNRWVISNISPSRMYVNYLLDTTKFRGMPAPGEELGPILTETQLKRATINNAELVFYVKDNPYYSTNTQYSLRADRVRDSLNITNPVALTDAQAASGLTSQSFVRGDSVTVNITPLIQAYTSGDSQNRGTAIRSLQELLNFGKLEFWHFTDAPIDKKPKLRVTYTPPFL